MNILVVEDNEIKLQKIITYLSDEFSIDKLDSALSYASGLKKLQEFNYDFVVLDMSLPTYDKIGSENRGRTRVFGGKEIARQIKRYGVMTRFLIITQYEGFTVADKYLSLSDIHEELRNDFDDRYIGLVHFSSSDNSWKTNLKHLLG